jgi:hypothetical protein
VEGDNEQVADFFPEQIKGCEIDVRFTDDYEFWPWGFGECTENSLCNSCICSVKLCDIGFKNRCLKSNFQESRLPRSLDNLKPETATVICEP